MDVDFNKYRLLRTMVSSRHTCRRSRMICVTQRTTTLKSITYRCKQLVAEASHLFLRRPGSSLASYFLSHSPYSCQAVWAVACETCHLQAIRSTVRPVLLSSSHTHTLTLVGQLRIALDTRLSIAFSHGQPPLTACDEQRSTLSQNHEHREALVQGYRCGS